MGNMYDMIVVGGGPGGYTAGLYAARAGLKVAVVEKLSAGGQMALTNQVDNYPGFVDGIDGFELAQNMETQAQRFGVESILAEVEDLELEGDVKKLITSEGNMEARTLVLATGANPRKLGLPGEDALVGRGVNYCAACDGMRYRGKTVVVVGGGNSAAADAMVLSRIAEKVIVVHRRDTLRATKVYHDPLMQAENVEFLWNSAVKELLYDNKLTGLRIENLLTGHVQDIPCDGLFVSIGRAPATALVEGKLALENGYIVADESTRASVPGVFAVGDVRTKQVRQIVTAVADGAVAAHYAEEYLAKVL